MTDDTFNQRMNKRIALELAESDNPRNHYQAQLDRHWQSQRDLEFDEDDMYEVGGFLEYPSQTPSFHKSKRDRDWRVR